MKMHLVPGIDCDFHKWSCGLVVTVEDLYSPSTFGPSEDSRCACGELTGSEHDGKICGQCLVDVSCDSRQIRRVRMGHIALNALCRHPLDADTLVRRFPIAPVDLRRGKDGCVNELGRDYEELVKSASRLRKRVGEDPREIGTAHCTGVTGEVDQALAQVVGVQASPAAATQPPPSSLASLLPELALTADPALLSVIRSMGYALECHGTL